jgi:hypothetical protein
MENSFEEKWKDVLVLAENHIGEKPDIPALLFLIGVQEVGKFGKKFTKDQKLDVMHVAICTLLSQYGFYEYNGHDEEGWPHFRETEKLPKMDALQQSKLMREAIVDYFFGKETGEGKMTI